LNLPTGTEFGLISQDVQNVLPSIITTIVNPEEKDTAGNIIVPELHYKGLNYIEIIPILVQAVKELNTRNDSVNTALNNRIDSLSQVINTFNSKFNDIYEKIDSCCTKHNNGNHNGGKSFIEPPTNSTDVTLENQQTVVLNQNVPNPFAENTSITYYIPENSGYAQIIFNDNTGKIIKTVDLTEKGNGILNVFADNLSSGIYTYSLVIDGKIIDSKRMVRTK
jgi:hypothetical protein